MRSRGSWWGATATTCCCGAGGWWGRRWGCGGVRVQRARRRVARGGVAGGGVEGGARLRLRHRGGARAAPARALRLPHDVLPRALLRRRGLGARARPAAPASPCLRPDLPRRPPRPPLRLRPRRRRRRGGAPRDARADDQALPRGARGRAGADPGLRRRGQGRRRRPPRGAGGHAVRAAPPAGGVPQGVLGGGAVRRGGDGEAAVLRDSDGGEGRVSALLGRWRGARSAVPRCAGRSHRRRRQLPRRLRVRVALGAVGYGRRAAGQLLRRGCCFAGWSTNLRSKDAAGC
ncbi:hypothetical protein DAI22_03g331001 [Oryza sativa Japonica Group]|nr:hypothetical protein DAI22_03g331001 [Oryza sativa Japonica Group]